jgi:hypothetical protein
LPITSTCEWWPAAAASGPCCSMARVFIEQLCEPS